MYYSWWNKVWTSFRLLEGVQSSHYKISVLLTGRFVNLMSSWECMSRHLWNCSRSSSAVRLVQTQHNLMWRAEGEMRQHGSAHLLSGTSHCRGMGGFVITYPSPYFHHNFMSASASVFTSNWYLKSLLPSEVFRSIPLGSRWVFKLNILCYQ